MSDKRFVGKQVVVTGGGAGIGRAISKRLAAEGASVVIFERNLDAAKAVIDEIKAAAGQATCVEVDVSSESSVQSAFDSLDRVDVLINNAGIASVGNVETTTGEEMDRVYAVNVKGVFHCTKSAIPKLKASGNGAILNMASIASYLGISDRFAYSMTKGAVYAMTLSVAKDYIEYGIRCNCICPARVHTPFIDSYLEKHYADRKEEMFKELESYQPIGRMGKPEEIAGLAAFLCSEEAAFVTGSAYHIDGGVTNLR
jgi:2-keto-3-deoxy-L-fuconate dehydrogenase